MRQSRRSTQGVTLLELKEAEKPIGRSGDGRAPEPIREEQSTQGPCGRSRPGGRERRKPQRGMGSEGSTGARMGGGEDTPPPHSHPPAPPPPFDYQKLYEELWAENERLREQLQETELKLTQIRLELERVTQRQERIAERPALLELERYERRALELKAAELEEELKALSDLRADNQRLKDENAALIRVVSRLAK
ncbi:protein phosphatase 1 regulatory subunit 12C-like isoform X5 [Caloenas nicobarica]|uniref:protein phosphatase 1 regulatory subunit 12C-like isoform X5 n=1 Tax=Caloenas nicobarica TaxID=187106 RepID=UPI0032B7315D